MLAVQQLIATENQITALHLLMNLLRVTSEYISSVQTVPSYIFDVTLWRKILSSLLLLPQDAPGQAAIRAEFTVKYLNYCDDIRYYFLKGAA